jgi:hypothetical protein
MGNKAKVQKLLRDSEARTGKSVWFIVGGAGNKLGHLLISVWEANANLEVDLVGGLTHAKEKLILDWFETLA